MSSYLAIAKTNMSQNVFTVAFASVAVVVIVYILYHMYTILKKTDLKTVTLLKTAQKINKSGVDKLNTDVTMPSLFNGTEFSYSFWMYVNDFSPTVAPKMILFNGTDSSLSGASPIFYLDPDYVSLHVLLKTNMNSKQMRRNLSDVHTLKDCDFVRMNVPYVPMNRWVNVTLVVDNQYAQLFFDGELRKVIDVAEKRLIENKGWKSSITPDTCEKENDPCCNVDHKCCDKTTLSKSLGTNLNAGKLAGAFNEVVDGYLSQVRFFNYAITIDHAQVIYKTGPIHQSILSNVGIPMYGVRNPFYDLSEVKECSASADATT